MFGWRRFVDTVDNSRKGMGGECECEGGVKVEMRIPLCIPTGSLTKAAAVKQYQMMLVSGAGIVVKTLMLDQARTNEAGEGPTA